MALINKPTYHFIGVGGIGMSGLAELLVRRGHTVSGSDLAEGDITRRLAGLGVRVYLGHRPEHLGDVDIVVHSTAIKEDNPELAAARARGRKGGRPKALDAEKRRLAVELYEQQTYPVKQLCAMMGISKPTLYAYVRARG